MTYLPADAKGLCLALTQVARNDQDARVRPACENRLNDITDSPPSLSHGERDSVLPP